MRVTLPTGTAAEVARPAGTPTRGVVLLPDIGGLRPLFDDLVRRLADEHGWVVVAPEPWPGRESMSLEERLASVGERDDATVLADVSAAADECGVEPVGIIGFCMGGMYALKATGLDRFDRAAAFYGMIRVPAQWQGPGHAEPLDAVRSSATPVLAIIGTADPWTPVADVDELETTGATVVRYEGADHGFVHDPSRPTHRAADAADAWRHVTEHLST